MEHYIVNKNAQPESGDHEVHRLNKCTRLPDPQNREDLGMFWNCRDAVNEAKKHYAKADGCYWCCPECHTG